MMMRPPMPMYMRLSFRGRRGQVTCYPRLPECEPAAAPGGRPLADERTGNGDGRRSADPHGDGGGAVALLRHGHRDRAPAARGRSPGEEACPDSGRRLRWVMPDDEMFRAMEADYAEADALLLGRRIYEVCAASWPQRSSDVANADSNNTPKYVAFDDTSLSRMAELDSDRGRRRRSAVTAQTGGREEHPGQRQRQSRAIATARRLARRVSALGASRHLVFSQATKAPPGSTVAAPCRGRRWPGGVAPRRDHPRMATNRGRGRCARQPDDARR